MPSDRVDFVHLHNHMEGSYSDSVLRAEAALDRAASFGMDALALTDHGEVAHVPAFVRAAEARGMKPIAGVEAYFVDDAAQNIGERITDRNHLVLIAKDRRGWANLVALLSNAWRKNCLQGKFGLVDWALLEAHAEGLVCLSGCLAGPVGKRILDGDPAGAEAALDRLLGIFRDDFYVEAYRHGQPEEETILPSLLALAERRKAKVVLSNDCHYLEPDDWRLHDILIKTRFGKPTEFALPAHQYYLKRPDEMAAMGLPRIFLERTREVAEKCSITSADLAAPAPVPTSPEPVVLGTRPPMGSAAALRDAASVLGLSRSEIRTGEETAGTSSHRAWALSFPDAADAAERLEGLIRTTGLDARTAVVPGPAPLPLKRIGDLLVTQWGRGDVEAAGARLAPIEEFPELALRVGIEVRYQEGLDAFRRRRHAEARRAFEDVLRRNPAHANARYQIALVHFHGKDYDAARDDLERLLADAPGFERLPHLHSHLGWCRLYLGDAARALVHFAESVRLRDRIPGSHLGLGLAAWELGRKEEAAASLRRFLEMAPDHPRAAQARGILDAVAAGGSSG